MKRLFDTFSSILLAMLFIFPVIIIAIFVSITSKGPVIYWSNRVGKHNKIFKMPKFRTMIIKTPNIATHLLEKPETFLSPIGGFLRSTSLDEIPQLFSVIKGDMSLVGPRPALFNQKNLISNRTEKGIDSLLPGITGWAQINGRDELSIADKVAFDLEYMHRRSFWFDLKILSLTALKVFKRINVNH
jgi:O-antigen biosynthesis protein WbqP